MTAPRAVVVGAGIAGLAAASALAARGLEVDVLERSELPEEGDIRSVASQGAMPHVLLVGGAIALEALEPGLLDDLVRSGALGATSSGRRCHWWAAGAVRAELPELGVVNPMGSRALVESRLRAFVRRRPGVRLRGGTAVRDLLLHGRRVRGVVADGGRGPEQVEAALVVDATGRAAQARAWLAATGRPEPPVHRVTVDLRYTAVDVPRLPDDLDGGRFAVVQNSRALARIGVALPAEGDRWQIVLGGYFGDAPPADRAGLLDWAARLPDRVLDPLLARDWLGAPRRYRFPSSERRHWERVELPPGLVMVGDSVASFNPIYGQGMSSAAQQAVALGECLDRVGLTDGLGRAIARATARVVADPWAVATGADFIYPQTHGPKSPATDLLNWYLDRVMQVAAEDPFVNTALTRVQQLLAPPTAVLSPRILARVARCAPRASLPAPEPVEVR